MSEPPAAKASTPESANTVCTREGSLTSKICTSHIRLVPGSMRAARMKYVFPPVCGLIRLSVCSAAA
jgi:hypothetical protein